MKNAYALELPILIEIVEHHLVHDNKVALFPLGARGARRGSSQNVELRHKLDDKLPLIGQESAYI